MDLKNKQFADGLAYEDIIGEDYDFKRGRNPTQAKAFYDKFAFEFKRNNPELSAGEYEAVNQRISKTLQSGISTESQRDNFIRNEDETKERSSFDRYAIGKQAQAFKRDTLEADFRKKSNSLVEMDDNFGDFINHVDNDYTAIEGFERWNEDFKLKAKKAGMSENQISKTSKRREKDVGLVAFNRILEEDPKLALDFAESNANVFGRDVISLKRRADKLMQEEVKIVKAATLKEQVAELPSDIEEIRKMPSSEASEKAQDSFRIDPFKYAQDKIGNINPVNPNIPEEMEDRLAAIDEASDMIGERIPLFGKKEVLNLEQAFKDPARASKILESFRSFDHETRSEISSSLKGAAGFAARLGESEKVLAADIIAGSTTPHKGIETKRNDLYYTDNQKLNNQANKAIDALINTEKYTLEEARKAVLNIQKIDSFLTFGGYELPLPRGVNVDQFEDAADAFLDKPETMKEFSNAEIKGLRTSSGKIVDFDDDELEWYATGEGTYGLKDEDGNRVVNKDGNYFELDMAKALGVE